MKKRISSTVLAVVLACALLPVQAMAYSTGRAGQYETVSAGDYLSLAIKSDNSLWAWGSPTNVIFGKQENPVQPRKTPGKIMDNVASVSSGSYHTLIIKTDGTLWAVGQNTSDGEVGDGTTETRYAPVKIMDNVAAASTGQYNSYAIKTDGTLWAWGRNYAGGLGDGTKENRHAPVKVLDNVKAVSASGVDTMAVKTDGTLWAWGDTFYQNAPVKVMDNVKDAAMGAVSVVLKEDGTVWTFRGMPKAGLAKPGDFDMAIPVKVLDNVTEIASGHTYALALKEDGTLWSWMIWGTDNERGQLGNGTADGDGSTVPTKILDNVAKISTGGDHSLAIKKDGSLWAWGYNKMNQVGDGTSETRPSPVKVLDGVRTGATVSSTPASASTTGFSDVPASAYYADAVNWALEKKITTGKTATTFGPDDTCTVSHILTFLWRANGRPGENGTEQESVTAWAKKLGIDTSNLKTPCTRAAAVTYMWKAAGSPEPKASVSFEDVPASADYAKAVAWAAEKGITGGVSATRFGSDTVCTRGQIVTFLYRSETSGKQ